MEFLRHGSRIPRRLSSRKRLRPLKLSFVLVLSLLLFSNTLSDWPILLSHVFAATQQPTADQAKNTLQQFMQVGNTDPQKVYHGPLIRPPFDPSKSDTSGSKTKTVQKPLPTAEPAKMQAQVFTLDSSFVINQSLAPHRAANAPALANSDADATDTLTPTHLVAGSTPLTFTDSSGRLDLSLPRGSVDQLHAALSDGTAPVGGLSLHLSQQYGHTTGQNTILGSYLIEVKDAQNHVVHGLSFKQPLILHYHYQVAEVRKLELNPDELTLSWPQMIATARATKQPTSAYVIPLKNDPATHTLTAQITQIGVGPLVAGGSAELQTPAIPHVASVSGNSGQLSYSYPIAVVPGPGGFAPQLALTYSSESTNERHSSLATAGAVGDGWNLGLGSITMQQYPASSTAGQSTWYFLSGVGGVSDRLVPDGPGGFYQTEYLSHLRILFQNNCFHVWDRSGSYYELGCTPDSQQYVTDSTGQKTYRWDVSKILAPYESDTMVKTMLISYLQDIASTNNYTSVRDAAIKQIVYGFATLAGASSMTIAGTVDFHYHAPSAQGSWATAYGNNYNCGSQPPLDGRTTTLRCDDPISYGSVQPPDVMSTLTLDSVSSYVGDDSAASHEAFSYALSYTDDFDQIYCYLGAGWVQQYCAGDHLLESVVPTVYQNGSAHVRPGLQLGYTGVLQDYYTDPAYPNTPGGGQTFLFYLNRYMDLNTGSGAAISYQTAHNNTNGTPYVVSANGSVDDRHDPFYCSVHANDQDSSKQCHGVYNLPDQVAWSTQVVTQIQSLQKDSSASTLTVATTQYAYQLAVTGSGCNPITGSGVPAGQSDCVGDYWIPGYNGVTNQLDGDWADFYHEEFRGFDTVFTTSPSNNLTADYYFATDGWNKPQSNGGDYNRGQLFEEDVYRGNKVDGSVLMRQTLNDYSGVNRPAGNPYSNINTCNGNLNATYNPCIVRPLTTRTTYYENLSSSNTGAPWVQTDYTYDDVNNATGLVFSNTVYGNLLQTVTTSANAPTVTKKYSYYLVNGTASNGIYAYDVDKVSHSEIDDASGHVWQCQDTSYDEGNPTTLNVQMAGWPTSTTAHTDCTNPTTQAATAISTETGYDQYGNVVASLDPFALTHSALYSTKGCSGPAPVALPTSWPATRYSGCSTYDSQGVHATAQQNVLGQASSTIYDNTQGGLPQSATDANNQTTSLSYSYPDSSSQTVQQKVPGEAGSYTAQSTSRSTCTASSTLPCIEIDTNSQQYANAVSRTFYNAMGKAEETRTPLDSGHDLVSFTVVNPANASTFQSVPFRVPAGTAWIDPNGALDENGQVPAGTSTFYDALGRVIGTQDPLAGTAAEPGITWCSWMVVVWSTCNWYSADSATGNWQEVDDDVISVDANNHATMTFTDALGRVRYVQWYNAVPFALASGNVTARKETQYNALNQPTAVIVTDMAPQTGQTITSVTTTTTYNDLGQQTSVSDPDRGTHSYTYDVDGRLIKDVSGTRTIGTSYDLLGRAVCLQDAAPTTDGSGTCSSGSHPLVQNTYDVSKLGTSGTTDFPIGALTQTVGTTYYPDGSASTATEQSQHDQRGRPVTNTLQIGVPSSWNVTTALPTYQLTENYNDANQPMTTQSSVGGVLKATTSQAYDSTTGTLSGLSNNAVGVVNLASQSFDLHGQVSGLNFQTPSGTALASDQFTYDGDLRSFSSTASWQSGSGSTGTIFSTNRVYDPTGTVISTTTSQAAVPGQSSSGGSETQNYCYDEENRLVWAGNSGTQPGAGIGVCGSSTLANSLQGAGYGTSFAYTHLGQLWQGPLNGTGAQQQYLYCDSSHPHQVSGLYPLGTTCASKGSATATYSAGYDAWGNLTSRSYNHATATLSYDVLDELVQWNAGSSSQEWYAYDNASGRVLKRSTTNSGTSLTVYAFGNQEHAYSASGVSTGNTYYYSLAGRLIGKFDGGSNTQFFLTDALGSVLSTFKDVATTAAVLGNQAYGPYGNSQYHAGSLGTSKGFTGQYQDATGLDYYNARFYDPVVGRFVSADTVQGNKQGMDPYAYVGGNPETASDPTGHRLIADDAGNLSATIKPNGDIAVRDLTGYLPVTVYYPHGRGAGIYIYNSRTLNTVLHTAGNANQCDQNCRTGRDVVTFALVDLVVAAVGGELAEGPLLAAEGTALSQDSQAVADDTQVVADDTTTAGDSGHCSSFTSTTTVATSSGKHAIGNLKPGEKVWAYNAQTKKMELEPIVHAWINHDDDLVDLTLTTTVSGKHGQPDQQTNEVIHTTKKHPFLTAEAGFVTVADLDVGMHIVKADGSSGIVTAWKVIPGSSAMYNLEVAQDHTFTVGDGQWIVHNCTVGDPTSLMDESANAPTRSTDPRFKGYTEIGRALYKHAGRPGGANLWGSGMTTAEDYNAEGTDFIDELLTNPYTTVRARQLDPKTYGRYGNGGWVVDLTLPDGRGGRWTADWKTFIGLLDP